MPNLKNLIAEYRDSIYDLYIKAYVKEMISEIQKASDVEQGSAIAKAFEKNKIFFASMLSCYNDTQTATYFKSLLDYLDSRQVQYPPPPEEIKHIVFLAKPSIK